MTRPPVVVELYDLEAAAELLDALRGRPPRTDQSRRIRARLAEGLSPVLLAALTHLDKDAADADTP